MTTPRLAGGAFREVVDRERAARPGPRLVDCPRRGGLELQRALRDHDLSFPCAAYLAFSFSQASTFAVWSFWVKISKGTTVSSAG